jgi:hypothetical protein
MSWLLVLKVGPTVRSQAGSAAGLMTQVAEQDAVVSRLSFYGVIDSRNYNSWLSCHCPVCRVVV